MAKITSDWHWNHANILKYCNRPFKDVDEMNEGLIKLWNQNVKPNEEVYFLGDMFLVNKNKPQLAKDILNRINGQIHLIYGNHDVLLRADEFEPFFKSRQDIKEIKYNGKHIVLCHFAMKSWNRQHHGAMQFFGHSHCSAPEDNTLLSFDVGIDNPEFKFWSLDEVVELMRIKKETFNLPIKFDHH